MIINVYGVIGYYIATQIRGYQLYRPNSVRGGVGIFDVRSL